MDFEQREELVRKGIAQWNEGYEKILPYSHPEGIVHSFVTGETYEGHEGIRRWMREINDQFDRWELHIDEVRNLEPDGVVVLASISMRGRASGVELEQPVVWIIRIRDELVSEMTVYADVEEGLAAARASGAGAG